MNPLNNKREFSKPDFCGSKFHWEKHFPDEEM